MNQDHKGYKDILTQKEYCKVISANMMNRFGDSIDAIALSWLVYTVSNSASLAALNYAANTLPTILFQPLTGAYIERLDKKKIMVFCDIVRGSIVALIAYLYMKGSLTSIILLSCSFALSCFEAFRQPCGNAILPAVLEKEYYDTAFSLSAAASSAMELLGTASAGFIIAFLGIHGAVFIDAFTFFFSAFMLSLLKLKKTETIASNKNYLFNLKAGFQYLLHSNIKYCLLLACVINAMLVPFNSLQSALVSEIYQLDASLLSIFGICLSIGTILGSLIYPKIQNKLKISTLIAFCSIFVGISYIIMILIASFSNGTIQFSFGTIGFILGAVIGAINPATNVLLMKNIDEDYLARISGIMSSISMGLMPVLSLLLSVITSIVPLMWVFLGFGAIVIIITFLFSVTNSFQVMDQLNNH